MQDKQGREYAKLSSLQIGDQLELDDGFDCMKGTRLVCEDDGGLYLICEEGHHYIKPNLMGDGDSLVGLYPVPRT